MAERDLLADFDPDELAMLRQLFRDEAHEALEQVTARAQGPTAGSLEAVLEMMRTTNTLKGAAGTVGLDAVVELTHALEGALAAVRNGQRRRWRATMTPDCPTRCAASKSPPMNRR